MEQSGQVNDAFSAGSTMNSATNSVANPVVNSAANPSPNAATNADVAASMGSAIAMTTISNAEARIESLLEECVRTKASDLHLQVGLPPILRIDGALQPVSGYGNLDEATVERLIFSTLEEDQKQILIKDKEFDYSFSFGDLGRFRVNAFHEKGNLAGAFRLIPNEVQSISELGMPTVVSSFADFPRGLVLVTGPTGSGKSTTLYSIINALNTTDRKIITLEDPIEYGLPGISQIPIATGEGGSFAEGLRSVLRLDPDVVMVGEIRDVDTARTAIQASITGHLVLSSFHANSTSAAFARIVDMIGINPVFSSSIRLLIAQRLVRRLADNKEAYKPDNATVRYIKKALEGVKHDYNLDDLTLYREKPSKEHPFGFDGRTAIMEQMVVTEPIQRFIRGEMGVINTKAIEETALSEGMLTLEQKGILCALRGETTIEEVGRVI